MRVLFLDIDGVMNSNARARLGIPYSKLMATAIAFVRYLARSDVRIVVSSAWRFHYSTKELSRRLGVRIHDTTTRKHLLTRGEEIDEWVKNNPCTYAIVDDDADMLPEQAPRFVKTDADTGITLENMDAVCRILNLPTWSSHAQSQP